MITQVSSLNLKESVRDPRRKSQSLRFKNRSVIPYRGTLSDSYDRAKKDAFWNSVAIVAGSVLFTVAYLLLSAIKRAK